MSEEFPKHRGVIAFIDALGTKNIDNTSINEQFKAWNQLEKKIKKSIEEGRENQFKSIKQNCYLFSDSLILTVNYEDNHIDENLFLCISKLLREIMAFGLENKIYFRGAVSCKEFYVNGNMVLGDGTNEAYLYCEATNWIGIAASSSARFKLRTLFKELRDDANKDRSLEGYWHVYDIPMKDMNSEKYGLAMIWFPIRQLESLELQSKLEEIAERITDIKIALKYLNTIDLYPFPAGQL